MTSKCPKCGAQVANGVGICPDCGAQMPKGLPLKSTKTLEPEQVQKIMLIAVAVGAGGAFLIQGKIIFALAAIIGVVFAYFHLSKKRKDGDGK